MSKKSQIVQLESYIYSYIRFSCVTFLIKHLCTFYKQYYMQDVFCLMDKVNNGIWIAIHKQINILNIYL